MKKILLLGGPFIALASLNAQPVGIGTITPHSTALLHVEAGLSTTKGIIVAGTFNGAGTLPDLGAGSRLMFYPGKGAFRAGSVSGTEWDNANVGTYSAALGNNTTASDNSATAFGFHTIASGTASTAMGSNATASGGNSTAMGASTIAGGNNSTAMGLLTKASGTNSTAIGSNTISKGYASTVIGMYNDSILAANQTLVAETTPLFIVGNGSNAVRSNSLVVLKNGNVGIGTNAPDANLVINDAANATLQFQAAGTEKGFVQLSGDNLRIGTYASNDLGNVTFRLNGSDRFTLLPNGNATLTGTLTQNSDERFKQDVTPINNALDKVMQLNGYEYHWKPELQRDSALQIGLIAQNVEIVLPQLVTTDKEGIKSVAYQNMVPVLIEAIKELQRQAVQQQEEIKKLRAITHTR